MAAGFSFGVTTNALQLGDEWLRAAAGFEAEALAISRQAAQRCQRRIMQNASSATHAPGEAHIGGFQGEGPNVATGDYRRSWSGAPQQVRSGVEVGWEIGSDKPQALVLEYGGGNLPGPLPHIQPAVDQTEPEHERDLAALVDAWVAFGAVA